MNRRCFIYINNHEVIDKLSMPHIAGGQYTPGIINRSRIPAFISASPGHTYTPFFVTYGQKRNPGSEMTTFSRNNFTKITIRFQDVSLLNKLYC